MLLPAAPPAAWRALWAHCARRLLHVTSPRGQITKFQMPAMSPTMTEGSIVDWKKKKGEAFTAGEVLLEIETDKATVDVEAQDDGVIGKIIAPNGKKSVPVGTIIALLAEEGDDISNLEIPQGQAAVSLSLPSQPTPPPPRPTPPVSSSPPANINHDRPFFPSVLRLLHEHRVSDPRGIKGTGKRGMLTKGDVLAYLGKASSPTGTFKDNTPTPSAYKSQAIVKEASAPEKNALDALGIRQAILTALLERSAKYQAPRSPLRASFENVIADYSPPTSVVSRDAPPPPPKLSPSGYLDGLY